MKDNIIKPDTNSAEPNLPLKILSEEEIGKLSPEEQTNYFAKLHQSKTTTPNPQPERAYLKRLNAKPSNAKVGQAFIRSTKPLTPKTKPS